jgi:hypothetical protein
MRWYWYLIWAGASFDLVAWTYIFYLHNLFDLKLAITLVIVEVPITGIVSSIIASALHERSELSTEVKKQRITEYRGYLKNHYETELIPAIQHWGELPTAQGAVIDPHTLGEHSFFGSEVQYYPDGKSVSSPFERNRLCCIFQGRFENASERPLGKMGEPQSWDKFLSIKSAVHLETDRGQSSSK